MNIEKLKKLETNPEIIKKYVGISSFGKNRIVYLPLFIGIGLLLFVVIAFFNKLTETIGMTTVITLLIVSVICFGLVKYISESTKKKVISQTNFAPTCVAKKVVGNVAKTTYYCIYTTNENRHDEIFIDKIAEKIEIAIQNPQTKIEKEISILFRPDFIKPNEFGKTLPLEFTENKEVWRKQVSFIGTSNEIKEKIASENDKFAMVAIIPENARFLFDYYTE